MKIATDVYEVYDKEDRKVIGYKVKVYDRGWVNMCEFKDGKWQDCIFPTYMAAEKAKNDYNECWQD